MFRPTYLLIRRVVVFILGVSIVAIGVVMIVTPGPAIVVIPAGLALLATEFLWARRLLQKMKDRITDGEYFTWNKKAAATDKNMRGNGRDDDTRKPD